jgi:hypothetical protein
MTDPAAAECAQLRTLLSRVGPWNFEGAVRASAFRVLSLVVSACPKQQRVRGSGLGLGVLEPNPPIF